MLEVEGQGSGRVCAEASVFQMPPSPHVFTGSFLGAHAVLASLGVLTSSSYKHTSQVGSAAPHPYTHLNLTESHLYLRPYLQI